MLSDSDKTASAALATPVSPRVLEWLWSANLLSSLFYAGLALLLGAPDAAGAGRSWFASYLCGAIAASAAVAAHSLWRHWVPADLPVHRARARAADLPILRVRLLQVWALDSLAGVLGFVLAFLGFPRDVWLWFMLASAALLFLHHPAQLRLADAAH
jgi:hypothetical protein